MRSGAIRKRVELWKKNTSKNKYGEYVETWVYEKPLRAYKGHVRGFQTIQNDEVFDINWIKIFVRNQHDIREQDRIIVNGIKYTIEHIKPDDTERWLHITCKRIND